MTYPAGDAYRSAGGRQRWRVRATMFIGGRGVSGGRGDRGRIRYEIFITLLKYSAELRVKLLMRNLTPVMHGRPDPWIIPHLISRNDTHQRITCNTIVCVYIICLYYRTSYHIVLRDVAGRERLAFHQKSKVLSRQMSYLGTFFSFVGEGLEIKNDKSHKSQNKFIS